MHKSNILITGASGFLGGNLISILSLDVHNSKIFLSSRKKVQLQDVQAIQLGSFETLNEGDLSSIDCIIHCAAVGVSAVERHSERCFVFNTQKTLEFFERAARAGVKVIYSIGTMSEYGCRKSLELLLPSSILRPQSAYASSKIKLCEKISNSSVLADSCILIRHIRLFYFYGVFESKERLYPQIISCGLNEIPLHLTSGEQIRDTSCSVDVALRILKQLKLDLTRFQNNAATLILQNDGSGDSISVKEFVRLVWERYGFTNSLVFGAKSIPNDESPYLVPNLQQSNHSHILL